MGIAAISVFNERIRFMNNRGQNLIEFLLILSLVVVGSIFAFSALGGNLDTMFSKVNNFDPFNANAQNQGSSPNNNQAPSNSTPYTSPVAYTETISGYPVDMHADGSASFIVGEKSVTLPKNALDLQNAVFQTTGSSGMTDLVKDIAYLVQSKAADYPDGDVPVTLAYGTGKRSWNEGNAIYEGNAVANTITLRVGDSIMIYQYDQTGSGLNNFAGTFKIEGTVTPGNQIIGTSAAKLNSPLFTNANFTADFKANLSGPSAFVVNGILNNCKLEGSSVPYTYNWNMDYSNPNYSFEI